MIKQPDLKLKLMVSRDHGKMFSDLCHSLLRAQIASLDGVHIQISEKNLKEVQFIWKFILWLDCNQSRNWMNHQALIKLCSDLMTPEMTITPLILLCPSYRKDNRPGLNSTIGRTSQIALLNARRLFDAITTLFPSHEVSLQVFFADLSLELYEELDESEWNIQIKSNIDLLRAESARIGLKCTIKKLSTIEVLSKQIGKAGFRDVDLLSQNQSKIEGIKARMRHFYCDQLGWSREKADSRTENSITSYSTMGKYFDEAFKSPIMLYTANSYEKAAAYNLQNVSNPMFIFYPHKIDGSIMPISEFI